MAEPTFVDCYIQNTIDLLQQLTQSNELGKSVHNQKTLLLLNLTAAHANYAGIINDVLVRELERRKEPDVADRKPKGKSKKSSSGPAESGEPTQLP